MFEHLPDETLIKRYVWGNDPLQYQNIEKELKKRGFNSEIIVNQINNIIESIAFNK